MRKDMCTGTAKITQTLVNTINLFLQCRHAANEACRFPYLFHSILLLANRSKRLVCTDVLIKSESNGSETHVKVDKFLKRKCINDADQQEKPPKNKMPKMDASKRTFSHKPQTASAKTVRKWEKELDIQLQYSRRSQKEMRVSWSKFINPVISQV